ncbi:HbrB-like protein [Pleomassaria siparia CBS 279.74]|uniref:HbrB-like protein n=1 Tax=Pleomassaria siparia CBS 279.74 TaxID=1314801 RepID=A0A6G1K6T0_9PLEO|nr:HbrB-like protein [Pleomassaria siparia CBS 279.74]
MKAESSSPPPQTPIVQRPDSFNDSDSDSSQVTLQRRSPLPPRGNSKSPATASTAEAPNYSRPAPLRELPLRSEESISTLSANAAQSHIGAQLGHRPRQRSQGYFEPSLPSNLAASMANTINTSHLSASQIAAQTAMHGQTSQHMRKRSTTLPNGESGGQGQRQPSSPPPMSGQQPGHTVTFRTNGMTYSNGVAGGRMAATTAANVVFPRSPIHSPGLPPPPPPPPQPLDHGSPKPSTTNTDFPPTQKVKEKSKMKLFSKPKNIRIEKEKEIDRTKQPLPSPGKMGIGIHSSQALNRMMNQSTTSLVDSTTSSNASIYSSANASTSTLVPRNDPFPPQEREKEKHKHHFLSRKPHKKDKDEHTLPLSSASSTSRPTDPNAPQPLYSFAAPASPGHGSSFTASMTGLDLRHGGRHLRRQKKEERGGGYLDPSLDPPFRDRNQSFSIDRSEWPVSGSLGTTPLTGPPTGTSLPHPNDTMMSLGTSFGISGMSPDDAWPLLKARVLLIFEGEDPRPPVEDFNSLVTVHIRRCVQKRSPITLIEDLNELLQTGFGSLDQTLRHIPDERLIPHLVEMWLVVFTTILPFIQAVFLPLDLEFRGTGIMTTAAAAEFWGVLLPDEMNTKSPENRNIPILGELEVRRITLLTFRDIVILPRYDTLMTIFSRLSLENLNAGLESPSPLAVERPGTAGSSNDIIGSLNSTSQGSSGGYLEGTTSMTSSTFASTSRSRATSNTSAGSFSAHSIQSQNNPTLLQPSTPMPPALRPQPMDSAKVTETVGRMLQCVSVLVSLQSSDESQEKMGRVNRELKYNWLGRGRTGRQRQGFVGPRRGGGFNLAAGPVQIPGITA